MEKIFGCAHREHSSGIVLTKIFQNLIYSNIPFEEWNI